jgi:3'-phosphoadenosine 5'-phosphosulfate sulfotransferase (PAPS reductase)/FAD synthetase
VYESILVKVVTWQEIYIFLNRFVNEFIKVKELNLVFKEYIGFLKDKGLDTEKYKLEEGYYWLDKSIIKAFDKEGNIHKVLRIYIDDNLEMTFKEYKDKPFEIESWMETVERNKDHLIRFEFKSRMLIKRSIEKYNGRIVAVPSSGGKDSSVVTYLVKTKVEEPLIIFNNTTLDVADTYLHIKKEDNLKIINPKEGFYQWRERNNFVPTRFSRACCSIFKEGAMVEELNADDKYLFFMGMRNDESATRSGYGDDWKNDKWGSREWDAILPIREWTETDIWLFILYRGIDINPKYKKGYSRVGCGCACPYYSKSTWV